MTKPSVSLIVLTYNEEDNIDHCLSAAASCFEEIIIVDSFSTDGTVDICRKYTDRIYTHPFENQAKQFNWAIDNLEISSEWILRLDSDEMLTPELRDEICRKIPEIPNGIAGVYLRRRVYFMGRWMRHGAYYPMWFLRLFRRGCGRYEELTEEHIVLSTGGTTRFQHDFIDYNRKGLTFWIDKHNHWALGEMMDTMGAMGLAQLPDNTVRPSLLGTQEQQTRWLKLNVYARVPLFARPIMYFLYRYFVRLGFLDGKEGLIFHFLQGCWYRFLVDAKIYEAQKLGMSRATNRREYTGTKPWAS